MDLYITIAIIGLGIVLFVKDYFTIDTTSILIMALFIVSGVLLPEEGFSGFNHPATLTLGCMFVVSAAVFKSGIINGLSAKIIRLAKIHYSVALVAFCLISALFSAFVNDAAVVAIMIPLVLSVCRETGIAPSKLLIPVSFSALFGGTCTLIGTSTNILVSSIAEKSDLGQFGMFEFSLPALCLLSIGLIYLFFIGPFLLPNRKLPMDDKMIVPENYATEITILPGNRDHNKRIQDAQLVNTYRAQLLSLVRRDELITTISGETLLQEGDRIKIVISPEKLIELKKYSV